MSDINVIVTDALAKAVATVFEAVSGAAASAVGTNQQTAGAVGGVGGNTVQAGQGSQVTSTEAAVKNDVSVPEVIESLNLAQLADVGAMSKSNAKLYDITATALGLATLGATHNMTLQQQMASDHRDQNHDRQINVNETDAYAVTAIAALVERRRNPTPAA